MSCPWCNEELKIVKGLSSDNKVIIYKCQHCGNIVGAYLKEMEEYLVNFFNRYTFTFTPKPSIMKVE